MEYEGFKIDKDRLLVLSHLFSEKIDSLTEEIYQLAEESFNINSTKQLSFILLKSFSYPHQRQRQVILLM